MQQRRAEREALIAQLVGPLFEIQIRTLNMHRTAEFDIAAYWRYKTSDAQSSDELDRALRWFRQVLELQLDAKTPDEFLEFLKLDLYQAEIFVFTPTGDVIQLPRGATPIDFAYAVHTEVASVAWAPRSTSRSCPSRARSRDRVSVDGRCGEALERQDASAPRRAARTWPRA